MNEIQANDAKTEDAPADEMQAGGGGKVGSDVEKLRLLRLNGFLRELVRVEGRMEVAKLLGVNYKTVVRAEESGQITEHVSRALEQLLGETEGAETVRLRERVGALEEGMEELRAGLDGIRAEVAGKAEAQGKGDGQADAKDGKYAEAADRAETRAAPPVEGLQQGRREALRRMDPEVVTVEPAEDDPEVYGPAWPLVREWRRMQADHPNRGSSLSWLVAEERLLTLDLAMLEEHGLTLPPETQPLRGFGRRGQTGWRRKALHDTQRTLRRRRLLRWVRRVLTLGLWWR